MRTLLAVAILCLSGCATTPAPTVAPRNSDPAIYRPTKPAYYPTPYE